MRTKVFDCVQMKDRIQEEIYQAIKDLSPEEQIAYYRNAIREDAEFRDKVARIRTGWVQAGPTNENA